MAANWHVRIRGPEHQGAGRRRIGSRESSAACAAHQTPCRLHVPAVLVRMRMEKTFRRGNTMLCFSHDFTCKRLPSVSGRPSRDTLAEHSRRTRATVVTGARCESLQQVACRAVANYPSLQLLCGRLLSRVQPHTIFHTVPNDVVVAVFCVCAVLTKAGSVYLQARQSAVRSL